MAKTSARKREAVTESRPLDMGDMDETLGFRLRLAQNVVFREFSDRFGAMELTQSLYAILILIQLNPGSRQMELGAALGIRQTNLVERIDTLVGRGLVLRAPDPADRRANTLHLTDAGEAFMKEVRAVHDEMTQDFLNRLGARDHAALVELLKKLTV
jgi:DNA-binding MarR family transcriptional regulator